MSNYKNWVLQEDLEVLGYHLKKGTIFYPVFFVKKEPVFYHGGGVSLGISLLNNYHQFIKQEDGAPKDINQYAARFNWNSLPLIQPIPKLHNFSIKKRCTTPIKFMDIRELK